MRTVQETLDTVLSAGIYNPDTSIVSEVFGNTSAYMCHALSYAFVDLGIITLGECSSTKDAIQEYLRSLCKSPCTSTLQEALMHNDLPHSAEDMITLYKNWGDRPMKHGAVNVQIAFNKVIDGGFYDPGKQYLATKKSTQHMCNSIEQAFLANAITSEEALTMADAIEEYLKHLLPEEYESGDTLRTGLRVSGMDHKPEHLLAIYRNWDNRPMREEEDDGTTDS